uniref:Uncharacterized protein n=1 Tax=Tanacetum cinerariifolium TaxID=118510 RepID=A0A699ITI0_TANCI|nr:hypothetical protein [Tanacetum cinerariifolium]
MASGTTGKGLLLKQLAIENERVGGGVVVVLVEIDKEEMEMDIFKARIHLQGNQLYAKVNTYIPKKISKSDMSLKEVIELHKQHNNMLFKPKPGRIMQDSNLRLRR